MTTGRRIHHVGVVVDDIDDAKKFLEDVLGLGVGEVTDLGPGKVAWAPCGDVQIELLEYLEPEYKRKRLGSAEALIEHICFHSDDVDADYKELSEKGVEFAGPPNVWNDRKACFTKPASCDGVMYQFREPVDPPVAGKVVGHS